MNSKKESQLTVDAAYSMAIDHFNSARYTEADKLCTAILQSIPNHIDAINLLGVIAQKVNRHDLAVEQFQRAINIDNSRAMLYYNLGTSLYPLGRLEESIQVLKIALEKDPGNVQISGYLHGITNNSVLNEKIDNPQYTAQEALQKGISSHQSGQLDEAIFWYQKSLEIKPGNVIALSNVGFALQTKGKLDEAALCYQKAIAIKPDYTDAHYNLGNTFQKQGKLEEAVTSYQTAIATKPGYAEAHSNLGNVLKEQGRLEEAVAGLQKAIAIKPDYVEAYYNLGNALQEQGKLDEAVTSYQKAISIKPDYAEAHANLGNALQEQGKLDEAVASLQKAIATKPGFAEAYSNLGTTLIKQGKLDEAVAGLQKAIAINPGYVEAYYNLGNALQEQGKLDEAVANLQKAIAINPGFSEAHYNLGIVLQDQGKMEKAVTSYQKAITFKPDHADAHYNLGNTLQDQGKMEEAVTSYRKAIATKPGYAEAHYNLGIAFQNQGKLEEAVASYQKAIAFKPDHADAYTNLLFAISYYALYSPDETLKYHQQWDELYGKTGLKSAFEHAIENKPNKILKIGYVSPDFKRHPVSNFMREILQNHNGSDVKIYCYAGVIGPDTTTAELQLLPDVWRDTIDLNDLQFAQQIYDDGIDILIDLAGHTRGNHLQVFTYKPAPIQVTYLGYCTTTGLQSMDYWMTDPILTPDSTSEKSVETIIRLPQCWVCYQPSEKPPVMLSDRSDNGEVVFGSFNHLSKITELVAILWSRILSEVPGSKLLLKTRLLVHSCEQDRILLLFKQYGIHKDRLILKSYSNSYMGEYGLVDIALDPFPRTGGATTADALWMGVPVITLAGQRMIERQGASLLTGVGKTEWIATSHDEYVAKAVKLAGKGVRNSEQRQSLHNTVANSPLCDYKGFVTNLETAYRQMWYARLKLNSK
jgi:protein O-GlcNAc transferase